MAVHGVRWFENRANALDSTKPADHESEPDTAPTARDSIEPEPKRARPTWWSVLVGLVGVLVFGYDFSLGKAEEG